MVLGCSVVNWSCRGLPPGRHNLVLRLLDEKSEQSRDRYLNVRGFEVLDEGK